jgi:SprT protein
MDRTYLKDVAEFTIRKWWDKMRRQYPNIQEQYPKAILNNRLKTTGGRAWIEESPQYIDLSTELFWQYTQQYVTDTIPHELAHLVAYTVYNDPGHGKGWYSVIRQMGINTTRCHSMVNQNRR